MIEKIIHIADLHIRNISRHEEFRVVSKALFKEIDKLLETIPEDSLRIVIAGDLVHQKITVSNELFVVLTKFLRECSKRCKTIVIAGNHDLLEKNKNRVDSVSPIIDSLEDERISYLKESECFEDENIIWAPYSIFKGNSRPNIEDFKDRAEEQKIVGLFHAPVQGCTNELGITIHSHQTNDIFEGCDVVLMGDIHKRQVIDHKGIQLVYPGSLIQQNFGETVDKHGFLIWDVPTMTFEEHDIDNPFGFYTITVDGIESVLEEFDKITADEEQEVEDESD